MKDVFKVRAHHGMCLAFFVGEGYSSSFVENMWKQKKYLEENNPVIQIVCEQDHICKSCPNNRNGNCISIEKVSFYDQMVLENCQIQKNIKMTWKEFSSKVNKQVIQNHRRKSICKDCQWNSICEELEQQG